MEYHCRVETHRDLTPSVFELTFVPDRPIAFSAGQYISVVVPPAMAGGKPLRRPYSIASAPGKSPIELCIQRIEAGPGSCFLAGLKPGDTFTCFAPYGFLVFHAKPGRSAWFVATGTGIAPFRSMLLSSAFRAAPPARSTCLLGVKSVEEILYADDLGGLPTVRWVPCLSRTPDVPAGSFAGRVTTFLGNAAFQIDWANTDFYLCGNGAMIDEVKAVLKEHGVVKTSIYQEIYFKPGPKPF